MNTKNLMIIGGIILAILLGLNVYQGFRLKNTSAQVEEQNSKISSLTSSLKEKEASLSSLSEEHETLQVVAEDLASEKSKLKAQVSKLQKEISDLKKRIQTQRETIEGIRSDLEIKSSRVKELESAISNLKKGDVAEAKKLRAERAQLKKEMEGLIKENSNILKTKDDLVNEMLDKEKEEENFKKIMSIINKTFVTFQVVSPRKTADDKTIKRMKRKNNWNFTKVEFSMFHEEDQMIQGENFNLKIVDKRTKKPLALREVNPAFPVSSDATSIPFVFEENPVRLMHSNNQKKEGQNFEVQVYYELDGKEYLLKEGTMLFISDRDVIDL